MLIKLYLLLKECRRSGNYASARAIYNGILHFKTLKRTFGNLNKKMSQVFKEEEGLLSSYSYETSVDAVSHCIPCLGNVYLKASG